MIRFLVMIEIVLLVILAAGRFAFDDSAAQEGVQAEATSPATVIDQPAATPAPVQPPPSEPRPAWRDADRRAIARELLGPTASAFFVPGGASEGAGTSTSVPASPSTLENRAPASPAGASAAASLARATPAAVPPTAERPAPAADSASAGEERPADQPSPARVGEAPPSSARVAEAQRLLTRLGYRPGPADGVPGGRTEQAVRSYQQQIGVPSDGHVTAALLARLRQDARAVPARSRPATAAVAVRSGADEPSPGLLGTLAGGFQRLLGHNFDSVRRPGELRTYCRKHAETWIFDEGRHTFAYCGRIVAER